MKEFPFQRLADTNARFAERLKEAACRVIDSGWYLMGPETKAFEEELALFLGTGHAVGTANGLEAIRLTFKALMELGRLKPGDGVLVPANTFIASVLPLTQLGLKPRPVDPDYSTMSVSLSMMADAADADTRAALPVHLYGFPAYDAEGLERLKNAGIIIVEDNAQAIGAEINISGRDTSIRTGSIGDAAAISFYPAKNIGALGDAGAVVTSDPVLAETVRQLSNYGGSRKYRYDFQGFNSRMDEMQAAMLRVKLPDTVAERDRREASAQEYDRAITNPLITKPPRDRHFRQAWHQYVVRCTRRDELAEHLRHNGVETMIHYPLPPHRQRCYEGKIVGHFPVADRLADEVLSLPIANITPYDAKEISSIINRFK